METKILETPVTETLSPVPSETETPPTETPEQDGEMGAPTTTLEEPSATPTPTETAAETWTPSPTFTETLTQTPTGTATQTDAPTPTTAPTDTPTATVQPPAPTEAATMTPVPTPSATPGGSNLEGGGAGVSSITQGMTAEYIYDGDGALVKGVLSVADGSGSGEEETITYYIGKYYQVEVKGSTTAVRKQYYFGAQLIAVRKSENGTMSILSWVLGDHLGSSSVTANEDGSFQSEVKYTAYGEVRDTEGYDMPTKYRYTGQMEDSDIKLYWYQSRWYDQSLGRFTQPDTIIPNPKSAKGFDRYMYVNGNSLKSIDPTGHKSCDDLVNGQCVTWTADYVLAEFGVTTQGLSLSEKWLVADVTISFGMALAKTINNPDPIQVFKGAMGDIFIDVGKGKGPRDEQGKRLGNCSTDTGVISCEGAPDIGNITHEFLHILDKHYKDIANDDGHLASDYLPREYINEPYITGSYKCISEKCVAHPHTLVGHLAC